MNSLMRNFTGRNRAVEILENGGATYSVEVHNDRVMVENSTLRDGFMVSKPGFELQIPLTQFCEADLGEYIGEHFNMLVRPQNYLGAWVEGDFVFLDISDHWLDQYSAMGAGRARNQLAIFDIENGEAITVD